jgi:hypothetical protein
MINISDGVKWYKQQIGDLSDLVNKGRLQTSEKAQAQEMLKNIKHRFKEDVRIAHSVRKQGSLSPEEQEYYSVVAEAATRIRVKTNSDPIRSHWSSELYDCLGDFDFYYKKIKS